MPVAAYLLIDAAAVAAFAIVGRLSHEETLTPAGVFDTAWPFLAGLAVGWVVVALFRRRAPGPVGDGVLVWIATVAVGMLLRRLTDAGTASAFVMVAIIMLGILLLGWRAVAARTHRRTHGGGQADGQRTGGEQIHQATSGERSVASTDKSAATTSKE